MEEWIQATRVQKQKGGFLVTLSLPEEVTEIPRFAVISCSDQSGTGIPAFVKESFVLSGTGKVMMSARAGDPGNAKGKSHNGVIRVGITWEAGEMNLPDGDYGLFAVFSTKQVPVNLSGKARLRLLLEDIWTPFGEDRIIFPMGGNKTSLVFRCRQKQTYDGKGMRLKEFVSFGLARLYRLRRRYSDHWLVYEKFCAQAQDNGYAFFSYCMEQLSEKERKRVYFILDKKSPFWPEVRARYGRQVIPFLSVRHFFEMMTARLYVASESRYHGYAWKAKPNLVFREIRTGGHDIHFLQHGVTAFKKDDEIFGAHGAEPMTSVSVTGKKEQEIFARHFGYEKEKLPILGFARYDRLLPGKNDGSSRILVLPTWRSYLENVNEEEFRLTRYYQEYAGFLSDPRLWELLKEYQAGLDFYLHPRFAKLISTFGEMDCEWISLIPYGKKPLDGLLNQSSALVTDYSSIAWDVFYQKKPVIFFQFDVQEYMEKTGSYLDFSRDLFGKQAVSREELLKELRHLMEGGFSEEKSCEDYRNSWFAYRDQQNSARTYAWLKERGY